MFIMRPWGEWGMVALQFFSGALCLLLDYGCCKGHTVFMYRSNSAGLCNARSALRKAKIASREKEACHWLSKYLGAALPLVFRSSHSWTQLLSQDDWNMEKEKKQNNPQQPNTLAVAHADSACQFSQSRFPTQITDC